MAFKKTKALVCYFCKTVLVDARGKQVRARHCDTPACDVCADCRRLGAKT